MLLARQLATTSRHEAQLQLHAMFENDRALLELCVRGAWGHRGSSSSGTHGVTHYGVLQSGANQTHSLQMLLRDARQDYADQDADNQRLKDAISKLHQALSQVAYEHMPVSFE